MMQYFRESYRELTEEVTWLSWSELQRTTLVVIAGSVFLAGTVALMDRIWIFVLGNLY
jgi:preprotein translocase subunit SecE